MVSESIYTNLKKPSFTYPIVIEKKKQSKAKIKMCSEYKKIVFILTPLAKLIENKNKQRKQKTHFISKRYV